MQPSIAPDNRYNWTAPFRLVCTQGDNSSHALCFALCLHMPERARICKHLNIGPSDLDDNQTNNPTTPCDHWRVANALIVWLWRFAGPATAGFAA